MHSLILRGYIWLKRRSTIVIGYGSAELKGRCEGYSDIYYRLRLSPPNVTLLRAHVPGARNQYRFPLSFFILIPSSHLYRMAQLFGQLASAGSAPPCGFPPTRTFDGLKP